uniref:Methyltransferase type 11 n=1 Tax=uncultured Chloroflexota bacterium TaxID=166587 RepID=H5SBC8_9CHLR|nr:methyltransferase type 11 [uncultured Chloroflexota bacterium]BAL55904.1 methyltransferase type 11 [uncultured Chloroflexota bacterium]
MNKCGLALLQDLEDLQRIEIFQDMEKFSNFFLRDRKQWWPEIPWPPDPLHQWSRQLEYPYAYWHIQRTKELGNKVLDAGSGITFFPFYLAMHGYDVSCADNDVHLNAAFVQLNENLPGRLRVDFRNASLTSLPYEKDTFSHICCISVLEHMTSNEVDKTLDEFQRILIPSGILILTVDVFLQRDVETIVNLNTFSDFIQSLEKHKFELLFPVENGHLSKLLTTSYFREHAPDFLPWTRPLSDSLYHKIRYWIKTRILRRETFEELSVGIFVLRNQK